MYAWFFIRSLSHINQDYIKYMLYIYITKHCNLLFKLSKTSCLNYRSKIQHIILVKEFFLAYIS